MIEFEIWTGKHSIETDMPTGVKMVAKVKAIDFRTACMKLELTSKLSTIMAREKEGTLQNNDYRWTFNAQMVANIFTGPYYETKELAEASFK